MLNYIFVKTNYHKIEIVIRNSRCLQNLHKSGAEKKYLGYKRFEKLYLQNGIGFTCCAISFKTIDLFWLKSSQSGGFFVKARGWLKSFLVCFQPTNRLWIDYYFTVCSRNETLFFSIKLTERLQNTRPTNRTVKRTATAVRGPVVDECKFYNSNE